MGAPKVLASNILIDSRILQDLNDMGGGNFVLFWRVKVSCATGNDKCKTEKVFLLL